MGNLKVGSSRRHRGTCIPGMLVIHDINHSQEKLLSVQVFFPSSLENEMMEFLLYLMSCVSSLIHELVNSCYAIKKYFSI